MYKNSIEENRVEFGREMARDMPGAQSVLSGAELRAQTVNSN